MPWKTWLLGNRVGVTLKTRQSQVLASGGGGMGEKAGAPDRGLGLREKRVPAFWVSRSRPGRMTSGRLFLSLDLGFLI